MARMSNIKHELSLKHWQGLIQQQAESGLNVKQWCETNNISKDAFYYWLKLVRERSVDQLPAEVKTALTVQAKEEPVSFKKLEVQSPLPGFNPAVVIHLPSATLEINSGADQHTVEAVLLALKAVC